MLNRRGFLAAMLGTAVIPKDVLAGLATAAPIKTALGWVCIFKETWVEKLPDGSDFESHCSFSVPGEVAHEFRFENKVTGALS